MTQGTTAPRSTDFQAALEQRLIQARRDGQLTVDITAGDLHRQVGGYPGTEHRMPTCCQVMRANMRANDEILEAPPSGDGASLVVRYRVA